MSAPLQDTIVALSSATGVGARALVRLSGPAAVNVIDKCFQSRGTLSDSSRRRYHGHLTLHQLQVDLPAEVYVWPAPRTYTGQPLVELHVPACPPLVDALIAQCLSAGARAAGPGEFTMRAFLAGKLDLTKAEAVLAVIEAADHDELQLALQQLAGGLTTPLQQLRSDLLDMLADIEAGLDFADEDIAFVNRDDLLLRLGNAIAHITLLGQQLDKRSISQRGFRVVLAGPPNAGKSSLFNALGGGKALVSQIPGTTRDYLTKTVVIEGRKIELVDTAGWQTATDAIEKQAQSLGQQQGQHADLVLLCEEAGFASVSNGPKFVDTHVKVVRVATKCDLAAAPPRVIATSARDGTGLEVLRTCLRDKAAAASEPPLAPSASRCRHHVDSCLEHLRQGHRLVLEEDMPELLALELRAALEQLGEMVGAVYTDDLLDRIFSRFCIGK